MLRYLPAAAAIALLPILEAAARNNIAACAQRDVIVQRLAARYGEHRNNMMLDTRGNLVELFSNRETGSWTLIVSIPGGPTCVLNSGRDFVQEHRDPQS